MKYIWICVFALFWGYGVSLSPWVMVDLSFWFLFLAGAIGVGINIGERMKKQP